MILVAFAGFTRIGFVGRSDSASVALVFAKLLTLHSLSVYESGS